MQIKRMIAVCASLTLTISVAGCGSADTKDNTSSQTEQVQLEEQTDRTGSDEEQNESALKKRWTHRNQTKKMIL